MTGGERDANSVPPRIGWGNATRLDVAAGNHDRPRDLLHQRRLRHERACLGPHRRPIPHRRTAGTDSNKVSQRADPTGWRCRSGRRATAVSLGARQGDDEAVAHPPQGFEARHLHSQRSSRKRRVGG